MIVNLKRKHMLIMSSLVVILTLLYVLSNMIDLSALHAVRAKANLIASIDSSMERDMVNLSMGRLFHYDSLSLGVRRTNKLVAEMQVMLPADEVVQIQFGKLLQSLEVQDPPLQAFMRGNAVLQNSLRYITLFIHQTSHDRPELEEFLIHLHRDLLSIVIMRDLEKINHLNPYVQQLKDKGFAGFAKHVQVIVDYYPRNDEAMEAFEHCGVQENAAAVADAYDLWADGELKKQRLYQWLLLVFSLGLIMYIGWVLYRMNRVSASLMISNRELKYQKLALDEHANVSITDAEGVITYVNERFCQLSGYAQDELLGKNHRMVQSGLHNKRFYTNMWQTIESGQVWRGELINRCKDGSLFYVMSTIVPFLDEHGKPYQYVAVRNDISPLKWAVSELKAGQERYRGLIEDMPMPVGVHRDGKWLFVNPAMVEMFAAPNAEALIGTDVLKRVHPDEQGIVQERLINAVMQGMKATPVEERLLRVDGEAFYAEVQGMLVEWNGEKAVLVTGHDISERKQQEVYQEKIEHTQRLESLGVLAGGIAHDFNNLLTAVLGNAALAEKYAKEDAKMLKYLHRISSASKRAAELCKQMLAYSGQGKMHIQAVDMFEMVSDMTSLLGVSTEKRMHIEHDANTNLVVEGDVSQLQQVVMNLVINASESMEGKQGGSVHVRMGKMQADRAWLDQSILGDEREEGCYVYIEVQDEGCGMDEATISRIFEPFYTTKFTGRGLGMSAMLGIVGSHSGAIHIDSVLDQGTTIRVLFPCTSKTTAKEVQEDAIEHHGSGTVLVVDDEETVLEFAQALLEDMDYQTITAMNGAEALEVFEEHQQKIVAVISDVTMPKMDGLQLCEKIRALDADVTLILSSGYDEGQVFEGLQEGLVTGFIKKPYSPFDFAKTIRKILQV